MAMTLEQLRILLSNEEPDYIKIAASLDASDTAHIKQLAADQDEMLASKAVYLASLAVDPTASDIVIDAADSDRKRIKISAASANANLSDSKKNRVAEKLIDCDDVSIQKLVVRSLSKPSAVIKTKLRKLSTDSSSQVVRNLCTDKLKTTP